MKRPSFQFYPGDWMRSTDLRACTVGARGLWMDMICLMHEGNPYGYLKVNQKVIHPPNLARIVGATIEEVRGWLEELEAAGVCSRDEEDCYLSRRMIRDEKLRQTRADAGKLGGNPALKQQPVEVPICLTTKVKQKPTPSSSSSSASAKQDQEIPLTPKGGKRSPMLDPVIFDLFEQSFWPAYPRKESKPKALEAFVKALPHAADGCREILTGLLRASRSDQWTRDGGRFVPHAATWLNQHRWKDHPQLEEPHGRPAAGGSAVDRVRREIAEREAAEQRTFDQGADGSVVAAHG